MSLTRWLVGVQLINSSSYHWLVGGPKIIPVDILAKVQDVRELPKKSDFEKMIWSIIARLFADNFDARLPGIVILSDRPYLETITRGPWNRSEITKSTKYMFQQSRGVFFEEKKGACGRHIDHGGWERARHSHILQVYRHPTSIQTPYKYTDTQQPQTHYRYTVPRIQVQTPKNQV